MQKKQNNIALVWFQNDLRVRDNLVLSNAISKHTYCIACFCFNPDNFKTTRFGFKKTEQYRTQFLIETVKDLKTNLKKLHIELFVFTESPKTAIKTLVNQFNITSIYLQKEWTSEEVGVLNDVKASVSEDVNFHEYYNQFLYHPNDINMSFSEIPQVFTNFRKKVEKTVQVKLPTSTLPFEAIKSIENTTQIPTLTDLGFGSLDKHPSSAFPFKGGESHALERLQYYFFETKKLGVYKNTKRFSR